MIVIPAVDVRAGACVQSTAIPDLESRALLSDPLAASRYWAGCGFARLHLFDVEAESGKSDNAAAMNAVLRENSVTVHAGGGVQSVDRVEDLIANGAQFVLATVRAAAGLSWLESASDLWPGVVLATLSVRAGNTVASARAARAQVIEALEELSMMRLAGIVVAEPERTGLMNGADVRLMSDAVRACTLPVFAAGGVGSRRDLDELADCGVTGAVVGRALYTGALEPRMLAEEYAASV